MTQLQKQGSSSSKRIPKWKPGSSKIAVVMISLNEEHNMLEVLNNLDGWAHSVFLVDSYSKDKTVDIALERGVHIVQRKFRNFGDQWNFAMSELPIDAEWTMKLDPDERLSEELKDSLVKATSEVHSHNGIKFVRRWWFMGRALNISDQVVRVWRSGQCKFSSDTVNEHPEVYGSIIRVTGELDHFDSPCLEHWLNKQNRYTTLEALRKFRGEGYMENPKLLAGPKARRMWIKKNFFNLPLRYQLLFTYYFIFKGLWKNGIQGYIGARLWTDVMRLREYKWREMKILGAESPRIEHGLGLPDSRVQQFD